MNRSASSGASRQVFLDSSGRRRTWLRLAAGATAASSVAIMVTGGLLLTAQPDLVSPPTNPTERQRAPRADLVQVVTQSSNATESLESSDTSDTSETISETSATTLSADPPPTDVRPPVLGPLTGDPVVAE